MKARPIKSRHIPVVPNVPIKRHNGLSLHGRPRDVTVFRIPDGQKFDPEFRFRNSYILLAPGGRQAFVVEWTGGDAEQYTCNL